MLRDLQVLFPWQEISCPNGELDNFTNPAWLLDKFVQTSLPELAGRKAKGFPTTYLRAFIMQIWSVWANWKRLFILSISVRLLIKILRFIGSISLEKCVLRWIYCLYFVNLTTLLQLCFSDFLLHSTWDDILDDKVWFQDYQ